MKPIQSRLKTSPEGLDMEHKKLDFEIKKIEMMLQKVKNQRTVCKASVLSASIERNGFWWNECEIQSDVLATALEMQLFELRKMKRATQGIEKA